MTGVELLAITGAASATMLGIGFEEVSSTVEGAEFSEYKDGERGVSDSAPNLMLTPTDIRRVAAAATPAAGRMILRKRFLRVSAARDEI